MNINIMMRGRGPVPASFSREVRKNSFSSARNDIIEQLKTEDMKFDELMEAGSCILLISPS